MVLQPSEVSEGKLTPRQRQILRTLIQEYIASAMPVGSSTIQDVGRLDVSSATIRNELATLEELGYVAQPHTSAGRVPTIKGYRYFVEHLMENTDLPVPEQRTIRHQFYQVRLDLDQWMRLTASVLARAVHAASMVTPPRAASARFKHVELISVSDTLCLMILVLQDSSVHQEMLTLADPIEQETLSQISDRLNQLLRNQSVQEVRANTNPDLTGLQGWESEVLERILAVMHQVDQQAITEIYYDGLMNVIHQPEFVETDKVGQLVEMLEQRGVLESILAKILEANGIQIIIGGEGAYEGIYDVSMVLSPYGVKGKASGVLGVLGPTRLHYARAISAVRYVANLMDDLMASVFGPWQG